MDDSIPRDESAASSRTHTLTSTILLIDDDPGIREACRTALERVGFLVYEADSAYTGFEIRERHADHIDLLVTDFNMPGLSGLELCEWLRVQDPELQILMISGQSAQEIGVPPAIAFLQKPFALATLTKTVREFLHNSKAACCK